MNTQNPNSIFVFDMDNTLIKTDKANNLAYSEAISSVLGVNYNIENEKRFTRNELKELFPQLLIIKKSALNHTSMKRS